MRTFGCSTTYQVTNHPTKQSSSKMLPSISLGTSSHHSTTSIATKLPSATSYDESVCTIQTDYRNDVEDIARQNDDDINNNNRNNKSARKTPDSGGRRRTNISKYCWSHGACAHDSPNCPNKAPGHQNSATFANKMDGSCARCE